MSQILIRAVTLTPNELYCGQSFTVSAKVDEVNWELIKNESQDWQAVKDEFADWAAVKNFSK